MIKVFGKDYTNIHFVARAINLKHDTENLRCLYVDGEYIAGTDGHRLHITPNSLEIEPGLYQIVKRTKTELQVVKTDKSLDNDYPNFRRLLPDDPELATFNNGNIALRYAQIIRAMEVDGLEYKYFEDSDPCEFDQFQVADGKPLYMVSTYGNKALIMPVRG